MLLSYGICIYIYGICYGVWYMGCGMRCGMGIYGVVCCVVWSVVGWRGVRCVCWCSVLRVVVCGVWECGVVCYGVLCCGC
jgi:hypothetical protein